VKNSRSLEFIGTPLRIQQMTDPLPPGPGRVKRPMTYLSPTQIESIKVNFHGSFYSKILGKLICAFYAKKEGNW
jgi:hypothetical protein